MNNEKRDELVKIIQRKLDEQPPSKVSDLSKALTPLLPHKQQTRDSNLAFKEDWLLENFLFQKEIHRQNRQQESVQ